MRSVSFGESPRSAIVLIANKSAGEISITTIAPGTEDVCEVEVRVWNLSGVRVTEFCRVIPVASKLAVLAASSNVRVSLLELIFRTNERRIILSLSAICVPVLRQGTNVRLL